MWLYTNVLIRIPGAGTEGTVCLGRRYCSKKQSPNARFFAVKVTLPPEKDWQSQLGNALPSLDNDIDPVCSSHFNHLVVLRP